MKRALIFVVLMCACSKLDTDYVPPEVTLTSPSANRTVSTESPRVFTCTVQLSAAAAGSRATFVELLTLTRVIEIEGGVSTVTDAATSRFPLRRLYGDTEQSATDDFSATFPFSARFVYTLRYRDLSMRVDSAQTTARCG